MPGQEQQLQAFDFLIERLNSQTAFTKADFSAATGWTGTTLDTYWSKHYETFLKDLGEGRYRVTQAFRRCATWQRFREHVKQTRRAATYSHQQFERLLMFELYVPLSNEEYLRATLDGLFYKDTILVRLRGVPQTKLQEHFPIKDEESEEKHLERLCTWLAERFIGYSVYHVEGRFRVEPLAERREVLDRMKRGGRYLVDETTAVVRFIFPCSDNREEPERIAYFFHELFVSSILELVHGQDEIWMLESGIRGRLHIWTASSEA